MMQLHAQNRRASHEGTRTPESVARKRSHMNLNRTQVIGALLLGALVLLILLLRYWKFSG
jgi:hypothetical protein